MKFLTVSELNLLQKLLLAIEKANADGTTEMYVAGSLDIRNGGDVVGKIQIAENDPEFVFANLYESEATNDQT